MKEEEIRSFLLELLNAGIEAASPDLAIAKNLPPKPVARCLVVGAGKASAAMAAALERAWPDVDLHGVVSTRYGHSADCDRIRVIEAGHPVPDSNSLVAANTMLDLLEDAGADDIVLALISGGGSACLSMPMEGVSLAQKQDITQSLLRSGAPISEMNAVRKSLSSIKGGKLAAAAGSTPAHTLVISDVPGDDPADVASGPTVAGGYSGGRTLEILDKYGITITDEIRRRLLADPSAAPSGRPNDTVEVIASPAQSLKSIARIAGSRGFRVINLGDAVEGEASKVAHEHAQLLIKTAQEVSSPCLVISGGETTVTLPKDHQGSGGRNTEYQLALAQALAGHPRVWSLAADSDGIDGVSDAAGALVTPDTLARASKVGVDPEALLAKHQSYAFFEELDDLIITGPTRTNVNDLRLQLII